MLAMAQYLAQPLGIEVIIVFARFSAGFCVVRLGFAGADAWE